MSDSQRIIEAVGVSKQFVHQKQPITILRDINLTINTADRVAIVGPSGSGKTTLLSILASLQLPTSGKIISKNTVLSELGEDERARFRRGHVGFIYQTFELLSHFTALENVMLPLELLGDPEAIDKAHQALKDVAMDNKITQLAGTLSGGECQRVAIARAFVTQPMVLFADEPTGNLDKKNADRISSLLWSCHQHYNTSIVLVTHNTHLASCCDVQYQLYNGVLNS